MSDYVPPVQDDIIDPIEQQPVQIEAPPSAIEMRRMGHDFDAAAADRTHGTHATDRPAEHANAMAEMEAEAAFSASGQVRPGTSHNAADAAAESASHPITPHGDAHAMDDARRFQDRADDELTRYSRQTHALSQEDMAREHLPAFGVREEAIVHDALVQNTAFHLDPATAAAFRQGVGPAHGTAILPPGLSHPLKAPSPYPGRPGGSGR